MHHDSSDIQPIELTKEFDHLEGVRFDQDRVRLTGSYSDELSMFRAKRAWTEVLGDNFLLEPDYDFEFTYTASPESSSFLLYCEFITACGRYAFWRLTNNQAPEAQFIIETAHIPNAELRHADFLRAPDLSAVDDSSMIDSHFEEFKIQSRVRKESVLARLLRRILDKVAALERAF